MNTEEYKQKLMELLEDQNTYNKLKKAPTNKYKTQLQKILKCIRGSGAITQAKYRQLYPSSDQMPCYYGLPKIHKHNCPPRLIMLAIGSISYESACFVAEIIVSVEGNLQNTQDFVNKLKSITVSN